MCEDFTDKITPDIIRNMTKFLDIKTFINITSCNKKFRKLYTDSYCWKNLLDKDFNYKYHPEYTVERYILCKNRKNLLFCENHNSNSVIDASKLFDKGFVYLDHLDLEPLHLENFGLIHNEKIIIPYFRLIYLLGLLVYFDIKHNINLLNLDIIEELELEKAELIIKKFGDIFDAFSLEINDIIFKYEIDFPQDKNRLLLNRLHPTEDMRNKVKNKLKNKWIDYGFDFIDGK